MIEYKISLDAGVEEIRRFLVLSEDKSVSRIERFSWAAYLRRRGTEPIALKTEHGDSPGEIIIWFPAMPAGAADWELWYSTDDDAGLLAGGPITVFDCIAGSMVTNRVSVPERTYEILTTESGEFWQVRGVPSNAATVLLADMQKAYVQTLNNRRVTVDSLPPVEQADLNSIYFLEGIPYVVVDNHWMRQNPAYSAAKAGVPGLLLAGEPAEECGVPAAPVQLAASGERHEVAAAMPGVSGVVMLSDDFVSHDGVDGLRVRRTVPGDARPGLVQVEGTEEEISAELPVPVYSAGKVEERCRQVAGDATAQDKMNADLSNAASYLDVVVAFGTDNNKWWRQWKSGWLEQGGRGYSNVASNSLEIYYPKKMKSAYNYAMVQNLDTNTGIAVTILNGFEDRLLVSVPMGTYVWSVKGYAAADTEVSGS